MNPDSGSGGGRPILLRRERLLLSPPSDHPWWRSHAQIPTVLPIAKNRWRVYFAARNAENQSHIVYADFDPGRDMALIDLRTEPILALGLPGNFDSAGMGPSAALTVGGRVFLYYIGYSLRRDVPYQEAIGLAISDDGGATFTRGTAGPVLGIGPSDPYFATAPHVLRRRDGFQMHYVSAVGWERGRGRADPRYHIKSARSEDGLSWIAAARAVLERGEGEAGLTRPWIIPRNGGYEMWFCCRGPLNESGVPAPPYRFGYALSGDGLVWQRRDELIRFVNAPQEGDWDCEMQTYPCIVPHREGPFVFYNGNGFGRSGFGLARIVT